ncbi:hypothetical protein Grass_13 [Bacillus phage Grass]|uniref:Uncharacterized protein n=1 Tax=Bacillus phage Grass TaxID=1406785 RepID=U5PXU1_BPGRA|nr:hypothetical protein Grass_13 [Bacillus phage Grass]AGY47278.1 hypothetical protein Grass_13 [Bacillus phage Grass]
MSNQESKFPHLIPSVVTGIFLSKDTKDDWEDVVSYVLDTNTGKIHLVITEDGNTSGAVLSAVQLDFFEQMIKDYREIIKYRRGLGE